MIKTEFMKLLEELDSLNEACAGEEMNEAIEDIDFDALTSAEQEADQLWKEIRELEKDFSKKVSDAFLSNAEYTKLRDKINELSLQLYDLRKVYERREWFQVGPDDWEHEDWKDEAAHDTVRDREEELKAEVAEMEAKLKIIKANVESQFEADAANLSAKRTEREKHIATSKNIRGQLAQAYAEVEPEVNAVVNSLNAIWEGDKDKLIWKADPKSFTYDKKGRVVVRLYTNIRGGSGDFDYDDFTDSGELTEDAATTAAEYAAEDAGVYPEQIADALELETTEDGWYSIPDSVWELDKEAEVYATETPEMTDYESWSATYWEPGGSDWTIRGSLKVEVSIYIGKKVK